MRKSPSPSDRNSIEMGVDQAPSLNDRTTLLQSLVSDPVATKRRGHLLDSRAARLPASVTPKAENPQGNDACMIIQS